MKSTKKKILDCSIALFNQYGISEISLRDIAKEVGISIGNLQYHFKKREDIVEAIYYELVEEMTNSMTPNKDHDLLSEFFDISILVISTLYDYRFFLLDFVTITRRNQKIKKHYAALSIKRQEAFIESVNVLIKEGFLRQQVLKNEYLGLFKRLEVMSNFWFSNYYIQNLKLNEKCIEEYAVWVGQSIYPYLTEKAKAQFST